MKMLSALQLYGAQRAKFAKKVHKPPLRVNVINFELGPKKAVMH